VSSFTPKTNLNKDAPPKAIIFGVSGIALSDSEKQFFRYANPLGFILFQRNCVEPQQVKRLVADMQEAVGRDAVPIFIDQEGGRVARLKPPHWPVFPPARQLGIIAERDRTLGMEALTINAQLIAHELTQLGIGVNCAPLADLLLPETDKAIGDRAYSADPAIAAKCARATAEGFLGMGILPVIKHFPGHGRAQADPHLIQPRVTASRAELEAADFAPFRQLRDLPIGMTSHILFQALDPQWPASVSPKIHEIIRKDIGFDGLLLSDDLAMKGIIGRFEDLVMQVLGAGSDVALHCSGEMSEMMQFAGNVPPMSDAALNRWQKAQNMRKKPPQFFDKEGLIDRLDMLLGAVASPA
jgi:beta-N-acetylhexosaminidase